MTVIIWLVAGILLVSLSFFLSPQETNPWPPLHAAGLAAAAYLLALVAYTTRKPFPRKGRIAAWIVTLVFIGSAASFSTIFEKTTFWQQGQLQKILTVIHRGIFFDELQTPLVRTLDRYHAQRSQKKKSLGIIFRELFPNVSIGNNIHVPGGDDDKLQVLVAELSDQRIVLIGQPTHGNGRNPEFRNYNGQKGLVQERMTLSENGVVHESEN